MDATSMASPYPSMPELPTALISPSLPSKLPPPFFLSEKPPPTPLPMPFEHPCQPPPPSHHHSRLPISPSTRWPSSPSSSTISPSFHLLPSLLHHAHLHPPQCRQAYLLHEMPPPQSCMATASLELPSSPPHHHGCHLSRSSPPSSLLPIFPLPISIILAAGRIVSPLHIPTARSTKLPTATFFFLPSPPLQPSASLLASMLSGPLPSRSTSASKPSLPCPSPP